MESYHIDKIIEKLRSKQITVILINTPDTGVDVATLKFKEIIVNSYSRDNLSIVFTIAHLYGHFIQFKDYKKYKKLISKVKEPTPLKLNNKFKNSFWEYEKEAFRIGKGLMLESFSLSKEIENKYQTFMETDFKHFMDYMTTGKNNDIVSFNKLLLEKYNENYNHKETISPIFIDDNLIESINSIIEINVS